MKPLFASLCAACALAAPASALASSLSPQQTDVQYLTAALAQLEAQIASLQQGGALACAAAASKPIVRAGEGFALAWGSVGAVPPSASSSVPMWTQQGVSEISIQQPGAWTYSFTFYAANGASTLCTAKVVVLPAQ